MNLHNRVEIRGVKKSSDHHTNMKRVFMACMKAKVDLPREVDEYFGFYSTLDPDSVTYLDDPLLVPIQATEWSTFTQDGIEINVADIPEDVTKIRIWTSH